MKRRIFSYRMEGGAFYWKARARRFKQYITGRPVIYIGYNP